MIRGRGEVSLFRSSMIPFRRNRRIVVILATVAIWPSASTRNPFFFSPPPPAIWDGDATRIRIRHARATAVT
jgi:hypothetical protein